MILSNNNAAISYISLSFSDGSSTIDIYQNQDVAVTFNQYGSITADLTVHYSNGDSFSNLSAVFPGCNGSPVTITKPINNDKDNSPFTNWKVPYLIR